MTPGSNITTAVCLPCNQHLPLELQYSALLLAFLAGLQHSGMQQFDPFWQAWMPCPLPSSELCSSPCHMPPQGHLVASPLGPHTTRWAQGAG